MSECTLCGLDFVDGECRPSCPIARGCPMIRCPRCGYEFLEMRAPSTPLGMTSTPLGMTVVTLLDLPVGTTASILNVDTASAARLSRLASYGIAAGSEVQLLARRPAVVVACGSSSIAVEDDVAREIHVRAISSPAA